MNKYYNLFVPFIGLLLLLYTAKINWSDGQWESVIEADARGYYAYLPAIFIYGDLNFGFYEEVEVKNAYDPNLIYEYRTVYEGHYINKYFVGESVLLTPFFLTVHFSSNFLGFNTDGYSRLYMIAITIAAVFYLCIGLIALKRTFILLGLKESTTLIVAAIMVFGTNLFYYSIGEVGMSHVYSFSMICCFIYQMASYFKSLRVKRILYGALFFGIIVLTRPINGIVLLSIPFLSQNMNSLKIGLRNFVSKPGILSMTIIIVLLIASIQLLIYKIQTGSFFIYSYGEEGFNFANPKIIDFLFSYKKGFFLYTPICLVALFGFATLYRDKFKFITLFSFLFLTVYILSSWWMWYYGGSFSSRVMVEYLPFFALLLGILYEGIKKSWVRYTCIGLVLFLVLINQIQTLQYRYYIIHWSDMNKEKYWDTFIDIRQILDRKIK